MTGVAAFTCCLWFVIAFTEVAAWTVDLDEVRHFLDRQKEQDEYQQLHYYNYYDESDDYDGFSEGGGQRGHHYAQQYGYEGYMEKKVHGYVYKGAKYLDGLRLALENYQQLLENCSIYNFTEFENLNASLLPDVKWNETSSDVWNSSWVRGLDRNLQWTQMLNFTSTMLRQNSSAQSGTTRRPGPVAPARNLTRAEAHRARCHKASREREHVRRLADLALFTARQLQNWATSDKLYVKSEARAKEEKALITRLAYFLDKLAEVTGYKPDVKVSSTQTERTTTTTAATVNPLSLALPEDVKKLLLNCLRQQSAAPATQRCQAPLQLPPLLMMMLNITDDNSTVVSTTPIPLSSALTTTPAPTKLPPRDPEVQQSKALESRLVSNVWSKRPQSTRARKTKQKRSVNEPLMKMVEYYTKHKAWDGANAADIERLIHEEGLDVDNHLPKLRSSEDRSDLVKRKFIFRFLKHPYRNIRGLRRPKTGNNNPNIKHEDKLSKYLEKLRKSELTFSGVVRKVQLGSKLKSIRKRSLTVQESEDPMRDISFYVKTKPGTNVRPSLAEAAAARASLERIFRTGNIEVVRRYGANYNPLIPSPFYFGVIKTISDI